MAKTIIRRATGADFPILLELDSVCFPKEIAYDSEELSYFMNQDGTETIVLEQDGTTAAFLILAFDRRNKSATVVTLDVREDCRRLGCGSRLMRRAEEIAMERKAPTLRLQVDVHNAGAIAFYEKHGFRTTRRLNDYYSGGHDAWLMIKTLPQSGGR